MLYQIRQLCREASKYISNIYKTQVQRPSNIYGKVQVQVYWTSSACGMVEIWAWVPTF
jgi:hypothetical protein